MRRCSWVNDIHIITDSRDEGLSAGTNILIFLIVGHHLVDCASAGSRFEVIETLVVVFAKNDHTPAW